MQGQRIDRDVLSLGDEGLLWSTLAFRSAADTAHINLMAGL